MNLVAGVCLVGAKAGTGAHQDPAEHVPADPGPATSPVMVGVGVFDDLLVTGAQQDHADVGMGGADLAATARRMTSSLTRSQSRRSGRDRSRPNCAARSGVAARRIRSAWRVPANFCAWK